MAKLILYRDGKPEEFAVNGALTIGRQKGNHVRIDEPKASRNHARVFQKDGSYFLEDLESSNGTKVNGHKITRVTLTHGDTIHIGATRFVFEGKAKDGASTSSKDSDRQASPVKSKSSKSKRTAEVPGEPEEGEVKPSSRREPDPLLGKTIGGYQIVARLGAGGMGTVYKANQVSMDRMVALKVLKTELSENREFARGFLREARVAGQLTHPALVQVHDFGEGGGVLYFSMEYIDGESVNAKLKRDGKIEVEQALEIGIGVCEALVHAANHRVVHQDIKPHNIMLDKRGNVKLMDLGLATITGREKHGAKKQKGVMGTPHYMAPEQSQQGKIDPRTDLYAFGCTLFHMLTGRVPFEGPNTLVILTKHVIHERPDPRQIDVTIPDALAELILEMMSISMEDRPSGPKEVLEKLREIKAQVQSGEAKASGKKGGAVVRKRAQFHKPKPALKAAPAVVRTERAEEEDDDYAEEDGGREETAGRATVRGQRPPEWHQHVRTAVLGTVLIFAVWFAFKLMPGDAEARPKGRRPSARILPNETQEPSPTPSPTPAPGPAVPTPVPGPQAAKTVDAAKTEEPVPVAPEIDADALKELQKALEARDRALVTGNFAGARQALTRFLANRMGGEAADRARKELRDTEKTIEETIGQLLTDAEAAAQAKNYRAAAYKCTKLLAADPSGRGAREAKELLNRIDTEGEPRFNALKLASDQALDKGRLDEAIKVLSAGLTELGGTKWADQVSARQYQMVVANQFLKKLEQLRAERTAAGQPPSMKVTGLDGKKVNARVGKIDGLALQAELGGSSFPHSFTKLEPDEVYQLVEGLGLEKDHLGKANLFVVLGQEDFARQEAERALKAGDQAEEAAKLAARLSGVSNLHVYDFAKWQHQLDWESPYGAWSTKNDQYVLESPEGGDTFLKADAIGGPFAGRGARISFEFSRPAVTNEGWFVAFEFGSEQRNVSLIFNAEGVTVQANVDEMKSERGNWKTGDTRVELAILGDNKVSVTINGEPGPALTAAGASELRGSLGFRIREASCAFDNIILRNVKE
ncbi:MAG: protein kinase [Planctomycetes bacterium]|nr:protein kinase [Planctomycetota bacterium]